MEKLFHLVCRRLGQNSEIISVGFECISAEEIQLLNKEFRSKNKPTDVLSFPLLDLKPGDIVTPEGFPMDTNPETGRVELGDIVICQQVAEAQAKQRGHSVAREVAWLYIHGMLHLFGYTHDTDEGEEVMNKIAQEVLEGANIE